jgi:hypothetical protein
VDASFSSFLRAEEKDRPFWFFSKRTQGNALKKKNNMKKAGEPPAFACLKDYLEAKLPK